MRKGHDIKEMPASLIYVVICVVLLEYVALLSVARLFRIPSRSFREVIPYLRPDLQCELDDLLDPLKEDNLATALGHWRFRKEQLKRIHLAQECIAQRIHNARILQEWGRTECDRATKNRDRESATKANALGDACGHYRINAWQIRAELYLRYFRIVVFPFIRLPRLSGLGGDAAFFLIHSYTKVEQAAESLAMACGEECRHMLIRTLHGIRQGTADAPWIPTVRRRA